MKRWLLSLLTGLLLTGMLAACAGEEGSDATAPNQTEEQGTEETQTEENEETAAITISEDEGEEVHAEEDITFTERSEEHTSELQSRFDLVCRLLLEKKKQNK